MRGVALGVLLSLLGSAADGAKEADASDSSLADGAAAGDCIDARALTGAWAGSSSADARGRPPRGASGGSALGAAAGTSSGGTGRPRLRGEAARRWLVPDAPLLRGLVSFLAPIAPLLRGLVSFPAGGRRGLDSRRAEVGVPRADGDSARRADEMPPRAEDMWPSAWPRAEEGACAALMDWLMLLMLSLSALEAAAGER